VSPSRRPNKQITRRPLPQGLYLTAQGIDLPVEILPEQVWLPRTQLIHKRSVLPEFALEGSQYVPEAANSKWVI
jgi:hypothetical protein